MAIGTTFEPRLRHDKDDVALPETKASYRPGGNARLLSSLPDRADAGRAIPGGRTRTRGSLSGSTPLSMCEISRSSSRLSYRGPVSTPPQGNVLEGTALWGRSEEGNAKHSGDSLGSGGRPVSCAVDGRPGTGVSREWDDIDSGPPGGGYLPPRTGPPTTPWDRS